jgi:hypothetical protein
MSSAGKNAANILRLPKHVAWMRYLIQGAFTYSSFGLKCKFRARWRLSFVFGARDVGLTLRFGLLNSLCTVTLADDDHTSTFMKYCLIAITQSFFSLSSSHQTDDESSGFSSDGA